MAEVIDTKDYQGIDRRASEGRPSIVYRNFPELLQKGLELRALQQAQKIVHFFGHQINVVEARRIINQEWQRIATMENGFREDDAHLPIDDIFRKSVVYKAADILVMSRQINADAKPGMPRSQEEEVKTNEIKEVIRRKLLKKIRAYERQNRWKTLSEKLIQKTMEKLIAWPGIKPQPAIETGTIGDEETRLRTAITEAGIDDKTLGGIVGMIGKLITNGTHGLLQKIAEEEGLREAGTISETTLDQSRIARWLFHFPAKNFIAGDTLAESFENQFVKDLLEAGINITVAHEIESTFSTAQAGKNLESFLECIRTLGKEPEKDAAKPQKKFMSMKLSSLALYDQNSEKTEAMPEPRKEAVKANLRQLLTEAVAQNVFIRIDMEYFIHKDVTFQIFTELLEENPDYADHLGMVFQCYLKDSPQDAEEMVAWAKKFHAAHPTKKVSLRVVKGANVRKDKEHAEKGLHNQIIHKTWHGKPRTALTLEGKAQWKPNETPLTGDKITTQKQYIEIMKLFEQNIDCLDVAYGTHNTDSIAHIIQTWMNNGQVPSERQIQTLLGMYNPLRFVLTEFVKQKAYVPFGVLGKILEYMARRFEEMKKTEGGKALPVMDHGNGLKEAVDVAA